MNSSNVPKNGIMASRWTFTSPIGKRRMSSMSSELPNHLVAKSSHRRHFFIKFLPLNFAIPIEYYSHSVHVAIVVLKSSSQLIIRQFVVTYHHEVETLAICNLLCHKFSNM